MSSSPRTLQVFERSPACASNAASTIHAVGDLGYCGHVGDAPSREAWAEVLSTLRAGDVTFCNLETPLAAPGSRGAAATPFVGSTASVSALPEIGAMVVSLANNHIADAGPAGIESTISALADAGVEWVGAGLDPKDACRLRVTELGDLRVGWLSRARTLQRQPDKGPAYCELDRGELLEAIRRHRGEVDVLVVSIHWGYMFVDYPHPEHRALTHELAAVGADLVLCHHAHIVQGFETVPGWKGRTAGICHNLGNFLFDWTVGEIEVDFDTEPQRRGVVVAADFDSQGLCRLAAMPTRVDDDWVVRWMVGDDGRAFLDHLERISKELQGDYEPKFRRQRAERNTGLALSVVARRLRRGDLRVVPELVRRLRPRHAAMVLRWLGGKLRP